MYPNTFYRVSVKALIRDGSGKVLVVKENQETWSLPGGGLDHGELPEDGLRRELEEELGVTMTEINAIERTLTFELKEKRAWLMWVVYSVEIKDQKFKTGEGVSAIRYIDPASLKDSDDIFERVVFRAAEPA